MRIYVTDRHWALISGKIKGQGKMGRPRRDDRECLNGIIHVLVSGCKWNDLPRDYGHYSTVWRRLKLWCKDGTLLVIWRHVLGQLDVANKIDWSRCSVDGSYVRAKKGGTESVPAEGDGAPNGTL